MANSALKEMVVTDKLSYAEFEQCKTIASPRVRLSIAELIATEHSKAINYRKILEPSGWQTDSRGLRIYGALGQLGQRFVTTNYDGWLDYTYPITRPR